MPNALPIVIPRIPPRTVPVNKILGTPRIVQFGRGGQGFIPEEEIVHSMGQTTDTLSPSTREAVVSRLSNGPVCLALLFGSHATGDATSESDVDIAVVYDTDPTDVTDTHLSLVADLTRIIGHDRVDVVRLTAVDPRIASRALDHGELLVGSPNDVDALRDELDEERQKEITRTRISEAEQAIERRIERRKHG